MLARLFGKRGAASEAAPQSVLSRELWLGETGQFLRRAGFAPDDPMNRLALQEPVEALLSEGLAELRRVTAEVNGAAPHPIEPLHLLPPALWRTRVGPFLLSRLDLSPYRPWNTIFLPTNQEGARSLGLPIRPTSLDTEPPENVRLTIEMIADIHQGRISPTEEAFSLTLKAVRSNVPRLFPRDRADFSDNVVEARANVRAYAFLHATAMTGLVTKDVVIKSQEIMLADPETQLVA